MKSEKLRGFIDLQVNGYKGVDFSSPDLNEDSFLFACREIEKKGTQAFLPTIITSDLKVYEKNLKLMAKVMGNKRFTKLLPGIHLEGPFISSREGYRGSHPAQYIKEPSIELFKKMIKWSENKIKMITLAAEVSGAEKLCKFAVQQNIIVSLGHQRANEKEMNKLTAAGAKALTHLGNGLPHLIHRHQNSIWAGLANDQLTAMIITDGCHLPVSLIKTIIKVKGIKNTILVSDVSPFGGMKPGIYNLWGMDIILKKNGFLFNPQTGFLAGSSSTMQEEVGFLLKEKILNPEEINQIAFYNPLRMIGLSTLTYKK